MCRHHLVSSYCNMQEGIQKVFCMVRIVAYFNSVSGKFWDDVENSSKWNSVIRFYLESFLEINMSAFINLLAVRYIFVIFLLMYIYIVELLNSFGKVQLCYSTYLGNTKYLISVDCLLLFILK